MGLAKLEIHFYQGDEGAVFLETTASDKEEKADEILLFTLYAVRMMVNFGTSIGKLDETNQSISSALSGVLSEFGKNFYYLINNASPDEAKLVDYNGNSGRKCFIASLNFSESDLSFDLKQKGFGILGQGFSFYGPNSLILLLRYLAKKRRNDGKFLECLRLACSGCATAWSSGLIKINNQNDVALRLAVLSVYESGLNQN